uniref:CEA cell adhesion molecule 16, tectorial membrane component n=1 Tax=Prolemur simus TaxID=1328070 RepID=A0A8C9AWN3_PROSS
MKIPTRTQGHFSKSLLLSALILALWMPQGSQAALHIQKIPEQPQKNQDLLLSVQGVPDTFQDINWYLGEETYGGTRLFTYIPELLRPQRDGSAMKQRDIVGFPNGSMLLRRAQPTDSGTYQVAITINPAWTMKAKTEVQVADPARACTPAAGAGEPPVPGPAKPRPCPLLPAGAKPLPAPGGLAPMTGKTHPRPAGQGHQGLWG